MSWRETLVFPPEVPISEQARETILRLCCESDRRAGSHQGIDDLKSMKFFQVSSNWDYCYEVYFKCFFNYFFHQSREATCC